MKRWSAGRPHGAQSLTRARVLLCEENDLLRELLAWALQREHFAVTACGDGSGLASNLASCLLFGEPPGFDVVVSSLALGGPTALEVLEAMYGCGGLPPILLMTGSQQVDDVAARKLGVTDLLRDPFDIEELLDRLDALVEKRREHSRVSHECARSWTARALEGHGS